MPSTNKQRAIAILQRFTGKAHLVLDIEWLTEQLYRFETEAELQILLEVESNFDNLDRDSFEGWLDGKIHARQCELEGNAT